MRILPLVFVLMICAAVGGQARSQEIEFGDSHRLQHADGNYLGHSYSGASYYYPIPRGGANEAELLKFSGSGGTLRHLQEIKIGATATSRWKSGWHSYNLLGTFADGVYYWNDYGDQSVWIVEKVSGAGAVRPGDFFRLRNKSYGQYLVPGSGKLNTTKTPTNASWRVPPDAKALNRGPPQIDGTFRIVTYNTYLMQVDRAPNRAGRAQLIGSAAFLRDYDVVVLNELFDDQPSATLLERLRATHRYQTPIVGHRRSDRWNETLGNFSDGIGVIRGGVAIASKWPIQYQVQYVFSEAGGWDYNANKGFAYARIQYKSKPLHVIATHTNAAGAGALAGISAAKPGYASGWQERQSQFREISRFIETRAIPSDELIVIAGDLNVIRGSHEYQEMLGLLNAIEPSYEGLSATWDPALNKLISDKSADAEWLDYILLHKQHRPAGTWHNRAFAPPGDWSDHFPVDARLAP